LREKSDRRAIVVTPLPQLIKHIQNSKQCIFKNVWLNFTKKNETIVRNDTFTNENIKKRQRKMDRLYAPSYVCLSAKFFNFFARFFVLFYFRSEKFRTLVNGKKTTIELKSWKISHQISQIGKGSFRANLVIMAYVSKKFPHRLRGSIGVIAHKMI